MAPWRAILLEWPVGRAAVAAVVVVVADFAHSDCGDSAAVPAVHSPEVVSSSDFALAFVGFGLRFAYLLGLGLRLGLLALFDFDCHFAHVLFLSWFLHYRSQRAVFVSLPAPKERWRHKINEFKSGVCINNRELCEDRSASLRHQR